MSKLAFFAILLMKGILCFFLVWTLFFIGYAKAQSSVSSDKAASAVISPKNQLEGIKFSTQPNNTVQIKMSFSQPLSGIPSSFLTTKPARIIVDMKDVKNINGPSSHAVNMGAVEKVTSLVADGRFRVIVDLSDTVKYTTRVEGNTLYIVVSHDQLANHTFDQKKKEYGATSLGKTDFEINNIDFRRQDKTGRLIIDLSSPDVSSDVLEEAGKLIITFPETNVPVRLQRRLDVSDFGTPISTIDTRHKGKDTQIQVNLSGSYDHLIYQIGNQLFLDVQALTPAEAADKKAKTPDYKGKKLSLNFQDIPVRAVLQLLAEFTGLNIVVSDSVKGNITLRLNDVPWDQALAIVLQTQGLGQQQVGNVMLVAPLAELMAREKQELESVKQVETLAPLRSELIRLHYAKAEDMVKLLQESKDNSVLSSRGSVSFDVRTNSLWVQDTSAQLKDIEDFIKRLDIPVRQVLIEARIVEVSKDYSEDLGVKLGVTNEKRNITGTLDGANQMKQGTAPVDIDVDDRLNLNLPAAATDSSSIGIALAKIGTDTFLDLELSALETEGRAKIVSSPRVITADKQLARIESGQEIPYQESSSSGATSVSFKKAVLSLEVTPQITPDNRIIMLLKVNKDSPNYSETTALNNEPAINTKSVETNVLVKNGETVVLGGIYEQNKSLTINKTPFLGDIPLLGYLFRSKSEQDDRSELLIFITPKIIMQEDGGVA
ncbi:MAG: pilQ [Gammaproteobacteria bacterium]|nr:pilQ [Gammaproteobacteria bacterium]